ncbi:unnamed protein product [Peronospora destructor]|nr:unnamed protein product [Peronospora destructor]
MTQRRALKLKVQLPVEDDVTKNESDVKHEYLDESDDSIFVASSGNRTFKTEQQRGSSASYSDKKSDFEKKLSVTRVIKTHKSSNELSHEDKTSEFERETLREKTSKSELKRLQQTSFSFSDSSTDEDSELEAKIPRNMDGFIKINEKEDVIEARVCCKKPSETDTDWDDDGWLQGEQDVENQKKEDDIVNESSKESDEEWHEDESRRQNEVNEDDNEGVISQGDISQARFVLRNITSRIPLIEETAIRRGVKLSGPPLEFATTHLDEYARKFRWPQHVRNLRNTNFSQDPTEILEDFELLTTAKQSDSELPVSSFLLKQAERDVSQDSAFAQVPRPMVALAAGALRRTLRKRKRTTREVAPSGLPSAPTLLNLARVGGQFVDHFVESLLSANGKALQGIDSRLCNDIDKRCWSSLPTKKKPIANWRFVLEHVRRTMGRSTGSSDAVYPPMKQE